MSNDEFKIVFEEGNVRVERSRYPTGAVKVFDGDELKKDYSKVLSDPTEKAKSYAKGLVEGKKS